MPERTGILANLKYSKESDAYVSDLEALGFYFLGNRYGGARLVSQGTGDNTRLILDTNSLLRGQGHGYKGWFSRTTFSRTIRWPCVKVSRRLVSIQMIFFQYCSPALVVHL